MTVLLICIIQAADLSGWAEAFAEGDWEGSYLQASTAVGSDSSSADAWAALSISAGARGFLDEAEEYARNAVGLDSLSAMAWGALARTAGDTGLSLEMFERSLELDPELVPSMVGRARCLMTMDRVTEALEQLEAAEAADPEWVSVWLSRSEVYRYMTDFPSAKETVNDALSIWPENRLLLSEAAWLAELTGRYAAAEEIYRKIIRDHPEETTSLVDLGMLLENQGRYGEAVKVYRELFRRDPSDHWCMGEIGICLEMAGDTAGARRSYLEGLQLEPGYSFALYRLGLLAEGEGNADEALEWYSQCVEADPGFVEAWIAMGLMQEDRMDYAEAERMYRRALEEDPYYAWAWGELGLVLEQLGRPVEAGEAYESGIGADSGYVWAWEQRGILLEDLGDLEAAAEWYTEAVSVLEEPGVWLMGELGFVLEQLGRDGEAAHWYSQAVETDSSYTFGLQRLAPILSRSGDHREALSLWNAYLDAGGYTSTALAEKVLIYEDIGEPVTADSLRTILSEEYPYAWVDLAWTYSLADPAISLEIAERAEEEAGTSNDQELWLLLAGIYDELGEVGAADRSYSAAAQLAPDSLDVWLEWGYFLFDRDREEEAVEKYCAAAAIDSNSFSAWSGLGEALLFSDRYDEALEALERSLELDPGSPWIYAYIGLAWEQKGNSEMAMDNYFRALSLSPGYDYAESRIRGITDTGYDPDWHRRRSRRLYASLYVDTRVNNGNVRERDYSGGLEVSYQYDGRGSEVMLEADHRFIETSKDYASDYSWTMVTASIERVLTDHFTTTASSSWDRQPGTVRPWQISSYLSFGYRKWLLDWLWFTPSLGIGQVNTHWASGLENERTDRTTFYGALSIWLEDEGSRLPSLWLWGNFYLPPDESELLLTNCLAELTFDMWDPLSLTLGYSIGYTRTPAYDFWEKYDTEFYSRLNLRLY
ncbi:MAG: hypothetical protein AVO35_00120 [Candidatus Aegiribacteria sp. MLS_C]|nr:MAG: hypothetical protein AVO35_00120 [Candidatus Aegiribacteria sp. MLS_C]